jgi:thioredoxin 1
MSSILSVTDDTFDREVLGASGDVLVEFAATWCKPCQALKPVLEAIAHERGGTLKVVVVDMDASPNVSNRYKVRGAPTIMVFRGGERVAAQVGAAPKEKLLAMLP